MSNRYADIVGLSSQEVEQSRAKNGSNELPPVDVESLWDKILEKFEDPLIRILLVALGITLVLAWFGYTEWMEGIGIAVAVLLATIISSWSEWKNETSFRKLQDEASKVEVTVLRNGSKATVISSDDVVVGDIILLRNGDMIPADGVMISGEISAGQAHLTGEPDAVKKTTPKQREHYKSKDDTNMTDDHLVFRGAVVEDGEGVVKIRKVGLDTTFGKLYTQLSESDEREAPLQVKLKDLAESISQFGYWGATFIAVSFLFKQFVIDQGFSWTNIQFLFINNWQTAIHDIVQAIILAVIVIVVAVPEGLPMMIAIVLSLNMRKLLAENVLVRKLLGIETAGSIDLLLVDKTGTLTKGVFTPETFVSGEGKVFKGFSAIPAALQELLAFSIRESTSTLVSADQKIIGGNASDRALVEFLGSVGRVESNDSRLHTRDQEVIFNSSRKFSGVQLSLHPARQLSTIKGKSITVIKGAPDFLLDHCKRYYAANGSLVPIDKERVIEAINSISRHGTRVIAICTSSGSLTDSLPQPTPLDLVGILGIHDPIREDSKDALETAREAGIQVVMVTGDRKETAQAVASELNLLSGGKTLLTSSDLKNMTDEQLARNLPKIGVVARALPSDKFRLVKVAQSANRVVGMTGDGTNDAPALNKADVGFAMGSGSEVAKEAADIVVLDDKFRSILQAVLYGRTIFKSIRKFIVFQCTINCASITIVFLGPLLGYDFPLTLVQLLWVNLVMDTLAALAFGGEPALNTYLKEEPIRREAPIVSPQMWSQIVVNGVFVALMCILWLISKDIRSLFDRNGGDSSGVFLTAFFSFFIFICVINAFNVRTPSINLFDHVTENNGFITVIIIIFIVQVVFTVIGGSWLRVVPLLTREWVIIIAQSFIIIPFDMFRKLFLNNIFGN